MDKRAMLLLLEKIESGQLTAQQALLSLQTQPFEDLGYAKVDHHRAVRQGAAEVIYGAGKEPEQALGIANALLNGGARAVMITRISNDTVKLLEPRKDFTYYPKARMGVLGHPPAAVSGSIVIASGGTSDIPVCEEAAVTAQTLGSRVTRLYDVGVSGLHRLLKHIDTLTSARVVICAAGMEGALASVIGGLVSCPVIAVPTSVGYGASFGGLAALLSMLNSCASGVSVVNIDNGFGAGYLASMINQMKSE